MQTAQNALDLFRRTVHAEPTGLIRSPGRVNLIGEHTDYNEGFVLPMAIDRATWIAYRPRQDGQVHLHTALEDAHGSFHPEDLTPPDADLGWLEYPKGVTHQFRLAHQPTPGFDGVITSDIPVGAGLSSSASLELGIARVFAECAGSDWDPTAMARLAQRAENQWCGVNCGIMDQLVIAAGRAGHALLIDCRSLALSPVPLPPGTRVLIIDSGTRRGLVDSAYNERRKQCEEAAAHLQLPALRDIELTDFVQQAPELDPTVRRRAHHVVSENERTSQAAESLRRGDAATFGRLMRDSHLSMRHDFEITTPDLDLLVELCLAQPGCFGARMTGGGFGGCVVALVREDTLPAIETHVLAPYIAKTGHPARIIPAVPADGTSPSPLPQPVSA